MVPVSNQLLAEQIAFSIALTLRCHKSAFFPFPDSEVYLVNARCGLGFVF